jgi:anti-sigma-K factor RskA
MDPRCEETRALAAELALGIVEGEERGRALQHLAECPDCRLKVEELSEVADELLLLAPHRESPVGFESRVLAEVLPRQEPKRRRRLRLVLAPAAAALAAAAIVLAIVAPDLRLASHYRHTLDQANGKEFESYALRAGDAHVGTVFSYEGSPSWVHVDVDAGHRTGLTDAELVTEDGSQVPLRWFHLDSWGGSGGSIPVDPNHVSVLRLSGAPGSQPLVAKFNG